MNGRGGSPARGDMRCDSAFPMLVGRSGPGRFSRSRQGERAFGPDFGFRSPSCRSWPSPDAPEVPRPLPRPVSVPAGWPQISLAVVAGGFAQPVHVTHAGDGSGRIFVVEQAGRIRILDNGVVLPVPFLDLASLNPPRLVAGGEQGLLSVAFPPGFASKQYFYVNYTRAPDGATVVARYRVSAGDANVADPASEEVILTIPQPFSNHNGGQLAFGPDGYLYIGMGDGGSGGDPLNNGQTPGTLLGKLLRIDVESVAVPYGIPPTNPFLGMAGYRPEIWALGLRNPWRFSFDRGTGDLYIGDVGQGALRGDRLPAGRGSRRPELRLEDHGGRQLLPSRDRRLQPHRPCPPGLRVRSRARVLRDRRPCVPRFGIPLPAGGLSLRGLSAAAGSGGSGRTAPAGTTRCLRPRRCPSPPLARTSRETCTW